MSSATAAWRRVPISETYLGLYDGPHATPKPSDEGPVFLGIGNITEDGHLDLAGVRRIAEEDFPLWTKRVEPRAGDIVFTYEATLNRYAIIPPGFRGCLGRRLALIRPNPKLVDTRFLHFYFFGSDWRATIAGNTLSGATVDRVPLTRFPDFPINLPPLKTQRRIASILSAYDDLIENNTRRIAILEEMAQRIYEEWLVRFRYPGHEGVRMVESELGLIPERWRVVPLGDVADLQWGDTSKTKAAYSAQGYVAYSASGLDGRMPTFAFDREGIVLSAIGARCGLTWYARGKWSCIKNTIRFWSHDIDIACNEFLYLATLGQKFWPRRGAAQPFISQGDARACKVLLPPSALMVTFREAVRPMLTFIANLESRNQNLRFTRDLLLPKLISGELDMTAMPEPEALCRFVWNATALPDGDGGAERVSGQVLQA